MTDYLIVAALVVGFVLLIAGLRWLAGPEFIERLCPKFDVDRFPPISEDEFIARCGPGTNREIALKVRRIIAVQSGIPYEHIYPEQLIARDLFMD